MRAKWKEGEVAEATALPAEVLTALDGANVYVRQPGEDGDPRVVVQPAGMKGWVHGDEDSERLSRMFPELTETQLQRATRYLSSKVRNHLRMTGNNSAKLQKNWVHSW
ncbi:hypothetical protein [Pseudomonas sp. CBZ-4]|uniref:hypothetical protein n=1 Tax=Pseudomonas sp. CBZ-4 TaxID=1163065 RepID=UPI00034ADAEB|nr:hypothetical protein [Pseudomonas sp. CBZ-4]